MGTKRKKRKKWKILGAIILSGLICAVGLLGYGFWEYHQIQIVKLPLDAPQALDGIKIVYAADFQYDVPSYSSQTVQERYQKSVDLILAQEPDLILLGGDYVTVQANWEMAVPAFSQLQAPLGVYGIFGNHDSRVMEDYRTNLPNITFLWNQQTTLEWNGTPFQIGAVADYYSKQYSLENMDFSTDCFRILLAHNPDYFETLTSEEHSYFDLALSGHLHGGQIAIGSIDGTLLVSESGSKYRHGDYVYDGNRIYVTSGLGGRVWKLPIRIGGKPEIVVFENETNSLDTAN